MIFVLVYLKGKPKKKVVCACTNQKEDLITAIKVASLYTITFICSSLRMTFVGNDQFEWHAFFRNCFIGLEKPLGSIARSSKLGSILWNTSKALVDLLYDWSDIATFGSTKFPRLTETYGLCRTDARKLMTLAPVTNYTA